MQPTEKLDALKRCEVLATSGDDALTKLAEVMTVEGYQTGQVVFDNGDRSSTVYVVASGSLEVRLSEDGALVGFFEAGSLFGEYAMFVNGTRTARVTAAEDSELLAMESEQFRSFLLERPEVTLQLLQTAVRRLQRAERQHGRAKPR